MYRYKMVQIPPQIQVDSREHHGNEAATYLESIANKMASEKWEFYRVDSFAVGVTVGCLGALQGHKESINTYYVVTFRQEIKDDTY